MIIYKNSQRKRFQESLLTLSMIIPVFLLFLYGLIIFLNFLFPSNPNYSKFLPVTKSVSSHVVINDTVPDRKESEKVINFSMDSTTTTNINLIKDTISINKPVVKQIKSSTKELYDSALLLCKQGKYTESLSMLERLQKSSRSSTKYLYGIAVCKTNLYKAGKLNGLEVINAWRVVKKSVNPNSKEFQAADSILTLFGEN
jgi:hypothetical protein